MAIKAAPAKPAVAAAPVAKAAPAVATSKLRPPPAAAAPAATTKEASKDGELVVRSTFFENATAKGEAIKQKSIKVSEFKTSTAYTSVALKVKKNLNNYEHVEISVMCGFPHYVEEAEQMRAVALDSAKAALDEAFNDFDPTPYRGEVEDGAAESTEGTAEATDEGEAETPADGDAPEVDGDYIDGLDRDGLIAMIAANDLADTIDEAEYPDDAELATQLKVAFGFEEAAAEDDTPAEDDGSDPYTAESLAAEDEATIKAIFETWGLGAVPLLKSKKIDRLKAHKAILDLQAQAAGA